MAKPRQKTDVRKLPDSGGGVNTEWLERMKRSGALKQYDSIEEMREARAQRTKRGVVEKPAHLLPDDHFRKRKRSNITLDPTALAIAKKLAGGNISRGIERALFHYHDCPRTDRRHSREKA